MNHAGICAHEGMRLYRNRSNVMPLLDGVTFARLNRDDHVLGLNGYCLDALEEMPAGSMDLVASIPGATFVVRGMDAIEVESRSELARRLIDEILAEERAAK